MEYGHVPSMCSPYGWRARVGLIVPSTNTVNEPEFWMMAGTGVTIHASRLLVGGPSDRAAFERMDEGIDLAVRQLDTAEVDIVAYGCTTGSILSDSDAMVDRISAGTRAPVVTTAQAIVEALKALNVRQVAVGTPYNEFLNRSEHAFLEHHGFEVQSLHALQLPEHEERRRVIGRISSEAVYRLARAADRPSAQAILLSCTNLATLEVIERLESELGKPVVSSNQATFWACMRRLGLPVEDKRYGRLFDLA